jgi:hypothetical protein
MAVTKALKTVPENCEHIGKRTVSALLGILLQMIKATASHSLFHFPS